MAEQEKPDYETQVVEIQHKLNEINKEDNILRIQNIDTDLTEGKLDTSDLSPTEVLYVHGKLHFYFHMKNSPVPQNKLKEFHNKLITNMDHHTPFDSLDE